MMQEGNDSMADEVEQIRKGLREVLDALDRLIEQRQGK